MLIKVLALSAGRVQIARVDTETGECEGAAPSPTAVGRPNSFIAS